MLSVVKIDTNDYQAVRTAFIQNFGIQAKNRVVITDFTSMKQKKDEAVLQFFTGIGDITYNYNIKKPNAENRGDVWAAPEQHAKTLAPFMELPIATRRLVLQLDYKQIARNNIWYLGLQLFIVGLHTNISLEVIKSNTADIYEAFMIAHAYETAVKSKKESDSTVKINKMDAEFENKEQAKIRQKYQQKKMFCSNNGSAYQQKSNRGNGSSYGNGSNGNNPNSAY